MVDMIFSKPKLPARRTENLTYYRVDAYAALKDKTSTEGFNTFCAADNQI